MTPSSSRSSAKPAANVAPARFFSSTMGRCAPSSTARSASFTWQTRRTSSTVCAMTANALPSRRLRARNVATASGLFASHTRWKPPRPLTARIFPASSRSTARARMASLSSRVAPQNTGPSGAQTASAASSASREASGCAPAKTRAAADASGPSAAAAGSAPDRPSCSRQLRCGPHAKQASGCAWKRRSSGSPYSTAQRSHMGKSFIDVLLRS